MDEEDVLRRIEELQHEIAELPIGSLTTKCVHGHMYFYRRWQEGGKRKERYVPATEAQALRPQIERRKELQTELKRLQALVPKASPASAAVARHVVAEPELRMAVRTGRALAAFAEPVANYKTRACFAQLSDYVYGLTPASHDKVLVLYGLRRTGKTTMIRQLLLGMGEDDFPKAAFIQATARDTLADVNHDLTVLERRGFRYVFIDEVTLLQDFIEGAALLSDVFAAGGMRVVLSGTDSLGFAFSEDEQLYDRCILVHTTFIPYREFEGVLGICGVDEYIRYGGTMSMGGMHYNENSPFASKKSADAYADAAIARNIQHSLRCYQRGGHFRSLQDLYEHGELTSAINRVVEDMNHRFTLEVFTRDFRSNDLGISAGNLRRDRTSPTDVLDRVDVAAVTRRLRERLEILDRGERAVELTDVHCAEIKEYLDLLDITHDIPARSMPASAPVRSRTAIAQPGLRYAQVDALVESLLDDEVIDELPLAERNAVLERIRSEVRGRMLEDLVLLETSLACPGKQVFMLQFPVGEFDMVVFDPATASCELYGVKHSTQVVPEQRRHLVDLQKLAATERRYGSITARCVLYCGASGEEDGVRYLNVEEYLRGL